VQEPLDRVRVEGEGRRVGSHGEDLYRTPPTAPTARLIAPAFRGKGDGVSPRPGAPAAPDPPMARRRLTSVSPAP
jgi:hypothetical protein